MVPFVSSDSVVLSWNWCDHDANSNVAGVYRSLKSGLQNDLHSGYSSCNCLLQPVAQPLVTVLVLLMPDMHAQAHDSIMQ